MFKSTATIGDLECTLVRAVESDSPPKSVVILCHGFGAPGTDLVGIATQLIAATQGLDDVEFIFPQAPMELDPNFDSRAWWMIDIAKVQELMAIGEFRELGESKPAELPSRRESIIKIIRDAKERHQLEDSSIIIGGFSQGSMLSMDVALNYPEKLGGVILWSCALINQQVWNSLAQRHDPIKIFQSHGTLDPILPFAGAQLLGQMLQEYGHEVEFHEFTGQHEIPMEGLVAIIQMLKPILTR